MCVCVCACACVCVCVCVCGGYEVECVCVWCRVFGLFTLSFVSVGSKLNHRCHSQGLKVSIYCDVYHSY